MPSLNIPLLRFLELPHKYRAYVAGCGSGKTWAGCASTCRNAWKWPKVNQGDFAPTYPQIRDIFFPTIDEVVHDWGLRADIKEVHLFSGSQYRTTIICRSMEKPSSIVGFKIGHALLNELDVMLAAKAEQAWNKIIARMRYNVDGLKNGIDVTTTPEGFTFVYKRFHKQPQERAALGKLYGMVQASTFDNALNLPADYGYGFVQKNAMPKFSMDDILKVDDSVSILGSLAVYVDA